MIEWPEVEAEPKAGPYTSLVFASAHRYRYHPVVWIQNNAWRPCLSHIGFDRICAAFVTRGNQFEPLRLSSDGDSYASKLIEKHGLYCRCCEQTSSYHIDALGPSCLVSQHWYWVDYEACIKCARSIERKETRNKTRRQRRRTFEHKMKISKAEKEVAALNVMISDLTRKNDERVGRYIRHPFKDDGALGSSR